MVIKYFKCQIGQEGLEKAEKKTEGDKKTPIGEWYLKTVFYRSDKILRPKFKKKKYFKNKKNHKKLYLVR